MSLTICPWSADCDSILFVKLPKSKSNRGAVEKMSISFLARIYALPWFNPPKIALPTRKFWKITDQNEEWFPRCINWKVKINIRIMNWLLDFEDHQPVKKVSEVSLILHRLHVHLWAHLVFANDVASHLNKSLASGSMTDNERRDQQLTWLYKVCITNYQRKELLILLWINQAPEMWDES